MTTLFYFWFYKKEETAVIIRQNGYNYSYSDYFANTYKLFDLKRNNLDNMQIISLINKNANKIKNAQFIVIELGHELYNIKTLNDNLVMEYLTSCNEIFRLMEGLNDKVYYIFVFDNSFIEEKIQKSLGNKLINYNYIKDYLVLYNNKVSFDYKGNRFLYEYILNST